MAYFLLVSILLKRIKIISTLNKIKFIVHQLLKFDLGSVRLCAIIFSSMIEVKIRISSIPFNSNIQRVYQMLTAPKGKGIATNPYLQTQSSNPDFKLLKECSVPQRAMKMRPNRI